MVIAQFNQTEFRFNLENPITSFDLVDIVNRLQKLPSYDTFAQNTGMYLENNKRTLVLVVHHNPLPLALVVVIYGVIAAILIYLAVRVLNVIKLDLEIEQTKEITKADVLAGANTCLSEGICTPEEYNQILSNIDSLYPAGAPGTGLNNTLLIAAAAFAVVAIMKR